VAVSDPLPWFGGRSGELLLDLREEGVGELLELVGVEGD
jgi:hypothetical protein